MYLKSKTMATLGLLTAVSVIFVVLSGIIEINTLFLLGLASMCVGVAIHEFGIRLGAGFYIASTLLSLIVAPNKIYCLTYGLICLYVVLSEFVLRKIDQIAKSKKIAIFVVAKFVIFNLIYIPVLMLMPQLIYAGEISTRLMFVLILAGQVTLYVYDRIYNKFMEYYVKSLRKRLKL